MRAFILLILTLTNFSFAAISEAKTINLVVPDQMFPPETSFTANFDGSVNVINPKLFYNGAYIPLSGVMQDEFNLPPSTLIGFCALLSKTYVDHNPVYAKVDSKVLYLNKNGTIKGVESHIAGEYPDHLLIDLITCR